MFAGGIEGEGLFGTVATLEDERDKEASIDSSNGQLRGGLKEMQEVYQPDLHLQRLVEVQIGTEDQQTEVFCRRNIDL